MPQCNDGPSSSEEPVLAGESLLKRLSGPDGADCVGYGPAGQYSPGTVGRELGKLAEEDHSGTPQEGLISVRMTKKYSGSESGKSDYRGQLLSTFFVGSNGATQMNSLHLQAEVRHEAGTVHAARCVEGYSRLGIHGSDTGDLTLMRVFEGHLANESTTGRIKSAFVFCAGEIDLFEGDGPVGTTAGFRASDQGHQSRVKVAAVGFDCGDFTPGAPVTAAFRSAMTAGQGKWAIYSSGNAPSTFAGGIRIGDCDVPSDMLEVNGFLKASSDGKKTLAGKSHELSSGLDAPAVHIRCSNATAPEGLKISFDVAPKNQTHCFVRCEDGEATRLIIGSDGSLIAATNNVGALADHRLLSDVQDAPAVLEKFRKRRFVTASGPSDSLAFRGVIAQEEEKISPELIGNMGDHLTVNYAGMSVEAAQGIKELLELIELQASRIDALEAKLGVKAPAV